MQKVKLLRPLDGKPEGAVASYTAADAKRLEARGLVELIEDEKGEEPEVEVGPEDQAKDADESEAKAEAAPARKPKAAAKGA